jgi:hypothetical protein
MRLFPVRRPRARILIEGDPSVDIRDTRNVRVVVKGGTIVRSAREDAPRSHRDARWR